MVPGPDYDPQNAWRRIDDYATPVPPISYLRGCARRIEAAPRNHWMFVPALRNIVFRWRAEHSALVMGPLRKLKSQAEAKLNDLVQAMQNLYKN